MLKHFAFVALLMLVFVSVVHADLYVLDVEQSRIDWTGRKVTGKHSGSIKIKSGKLNLEGAKITGGDFEMDMGTIAVLDIKDPKSNAKLTNHLKSEDFFSIAKFPISKFMITKVENKGKQSAEVTGNLTIKNVTHPVTIPVMVSQSGDTIKAQGSVKIDRTKWNVRYGSGKFFKGLGDKLIDDEFELKLDLVAKK